MGPIYHAKDISSIERIQRHAARFVKSDNRTTSSVTAMLKDLGWKDLAHLRRDLGLALLHKVVYDHIVVSANSLGLLPRDKCLRSSHEKNFKTFTDQHRPLRLFFCSSHYYWVELTASLSRGVHLPRVFQDSAGPGQVGLTPGSMRTHPIRINTPPGGLQITPQDKIHSVPRVPGCVWSILQWVQRHDFDHSLC